MIGRAKVVKRMSEWIYCKDKLPENTGTYLIAYDNNLFFDNSKKNIVYTVAVFYADAKMWNIKLSCPIIAWSRFQRLSED